MPRHHFCVPPPYTTLIGRATLCALLLAGGSGIAWDCFGMAPTALRGLNDKLLVANDALTSRAVSARAIICQDSAATVALHTPAPAQ